MKKWYLRCSLFLLFLLLFTDGNVAQSNPADNGLEGRCGEQPLGQFSQITAASFDPTEEQFGILLASEADIKAKRWPLRQLDEVNPIYKIILFRNDNEVGNGKCEDIRKVEGKLISPIGKVFDFKHATYTFSTRTLKFVAVERDGITFEVNMQFYAKAVRVAGITHEGIAKVTATGKTLGRVLLEFPFKDGNLE